MRSGWKKLFFWSSLGSMAIGTAVALARRKKPSSPVLVFTRIPQGCRKITVWTGQPPGPEMESGPETHDRYVLRPTSFKVWNILDIRSSGLGGSLGEGTPIFHVTHWQSGGETAKEEEKIIERFYGTVACMNSRGEISPKNHIARGATLVIRKCLVGGATNGIESGEVHTSTAPIFDYALDLTS